MPICPYAHMPIRPQPHTRSDHNEQRHTGERVYAIADKEKARPIRRGSGCVVQCELGVQTEFAGTARMFHTYPT